MMKEYPVQCDGCGLDTTIPFKDSDVEFNCPSCGYEMLVNMTYAWEIDEDIEMRQRKEVDHPDYYGGKDNIYEAIKLIEAYSLGFNAGNAVKYILRHHHKNSDPSQDISKACWYLERHRAHLQGLDPNDMLRSDHQKRVEKMMRGLGYKVRTQPQYPDANERLRCSMMIFKEAIAAITSMGVEVLWDKEDAGQINQDSNDVGDVSFDCYVDEFMGIASVAKKLADVSIAVSCAMSAFGIAQKPLLEVVDDNNILKVKGRVINQTTGEFEICRDHPEPDMESLIEFLSRQGARNSG